MTVNELIKELQKCDGILPARGSLFGEGSTSEFKNVRETTFVPTRDGEVYEDFPGTPEEFKGVLVTDV